jgi:methylenetetrahydrofolate dehydrogenase (NADP+)/methenyltetrahydrofolate cyclohydrolase
MPAQILDGKAIAHEIQDAIAGEVAELRGKIGKVPGLHVILVGSNAASQVYVKNKHRTCEKLGFASVVHEMPEDTAAEKLLGLIDELNADADVHGILVQLPLPAHIDAQKVMMRISPEKDVDGFHPVNMGRLVAGDPLFVPCTPAGIMELIARTGTAVEGKEALVIGRSNIVGKPVSLLLLHKNATVTIAHSKTKDLPCVAARADILVVAIGKPSFATADFIREGAVVIDVGINRDERGKLIGDVDQEAAKKKASWFTPVPGGVGPMTIAMLMKNTMKSFKYHNSL